MPRARNSASKGGTRSARRSSGAGASASRQQTKGRGASSGRKPYYGGYFGTGQEENVVEERQMEGEEGGRARSRGDGRSRRGAARTETGGEMGRDAIEMLEEQHEMVEQLFEELEGMGPRAGRRKVECFERIADALATHATLEEKVFYPMAAREADLEEKLYESLEEHLSVKRLIADLLDLEPSDPTFAAKCSVLKEQVMHHVEEERKSILPKVKRELGREQLALIGGQMEQMMQDLMEDGEPRHEVPSQTDHAPPLH